MSRIEGKVFYQNRRDCRAYSNLATGGGLLTEKINNALKEPIQGYN